MHRYRPQVIWSWGANLGYNAAGLFFTENNTATDTRGSLTLGTSLEYYFSDRWGIKNRIIYDTKGYSGAFVTTGNYGQQSDVIMNYLTVPIMANWHFSKRRRWYLHFGPFIGFLLKSETEFSNIDLSAGTHSIDAGLTYGIGYKLPINDKLRLFVEYDLQNGFVNVYKDSPGSNLWTIRGALNLGILFSLK